MLAADHVTPEAINFMARFGRGLICLTLTRERCERLRLPPMVARNGTKMGTAFTVSIEAAEGVTTGISAADRARTVQAAVARNAKAARPGPARPHLSLAGRGRRRSDARRPYRSRLRPGRDGRLDARRRDLRDHEGRRHHGAPARPAAVRRGTWPEDRHHRRPDRTPQPQRIPDRESRRAAAAHRLWRIHRPCLEGQAQPGPAPGAGQGPMVDRRNRSGAGARAAVGARRAGDRPLDALVEPGRQPQAHRRRMARAWRYC